jgi:hypothetical protein
LALKDESATNKSIAPQASTAIAAAATTKAQTKPAAQPSNRRAARRQMVLPLASLALLQPLMMLRSAQAAPASGAGSTSTSANQKPTVAKNSASSQQTASALLNQYYTDANRIPKYAVNSVAEATRAGIVVNHPNLKVLNPNQPATRGEIAAFIHQALVDSGRIQPLPQNQAAAKYVVRPEAN